jgi:cytochrome c biogenesis factor
MSPCARTSNLYRDGELVGRLQPGKNRYRAEQQVSTEMAIHTNWLRAEDVDVIADQINGDGSVYIKVLVKPLVNLIWLAGLVFVLGAVIALWPDAREARRLAERAERTVTARAGA